MPLSLPPLITPDLLFSPVISSTSEISKGFTLLLLFKFIPLPAPTGELPPKYFTPQILAHLPILMAEEDLPRPAAEEGRGLSPKSEPSLSGRGGLESAKAEISLVIMLISVQRHSKVDRLKR